jgi:antitoxin component YwqK of YwqJK toxin-antitoxin module
MNQMHVLKSFLLIGLLLLLNATLLLSQNVTDAKGLKQGEWRKLDAKGKLIYEGRFKDNVPQGLFTYYYDDGKVRSELTYAENGKSAAAINYHPKGKKMAEGLYVETKKDGPWKYFNERGTISAEEFYLKGSPTGVWKTYYDDGKLLEECPYVNGLKQGLCKQYFSDGSIKSELNFDKDKYEGSAKHYYPNGKPMLFGQLHNDMKGGLWTGYKDNGEKDSEIEYSAGQIVHEKYFDKAREEEMNKEVKEIPEK